MTDSEPCYVVDGDGIARLRWSENGKSKSLRLGRSGPISLALYAHFAEHIRQGRPMIFRSVPTANNDHRLTREAIRAGGALTASHRAAIHSLLSQHEAAMVNLHRSQAELATCEQRHASYMRDYVTRHNELVRSVAANRAKARAYREAERKLFEWPALPMSLYSQWREVLGAIGYARRAMESGDALVEAHMLEELELEQLMLLLAIVEPDSDSDF